MKKTYVFIDTNPYYDDVRVKKETIKGKDLSEIEDKLEELYRELDNSPYLNRMIVLTEEQLEALYRIYKRWKNGTYNSGTNYSIA